MSSARRFGLHVEIFSEELQQMYTYKLSQKVILIPRNSHFHTIMLLLTLLFPSYASSIQYPFLKS